MNTDDHPDIHDNTFCNNAGHEEYQHLQRLIDGLSDAELHALIDAIGITFGKATKDVERDVLEGVVDEADRETFYKEYHRIIDAR
jgi:hypothetical protein